MAASMVTMRVWRGDAKGGAFKEYKVEAQEGMVVLDVIHTLQATQAGDLACRWNCKAGKCGSCSAEINGKPRLMCMTRMNIFKPDETITVSPIKTFPLYPGPRRRRLVQLREGPGDSRLQARAQEKDGTRRMQQEDVERSQEFRKCIECFLCQNVCHVIRDHPENKPAFAGPRYLMRIAELEMHPLDTNDRLDLAQAKAGLGFCNITKCCTEVCPEHIHITDNAMIPAQGAGGDREVRSHRVARAQDRRQVLVKIHEYQGKAILRDFGVPVPNGEVADTPAQARAIAAKLGEGRGQGAGARGGRGKAGGVKLADDPAAAEAAAKQILGMMLKTPRRLPRASRSSRCSWRRPRPSPPSSTSR